eukprot:TRINITY_DN17232_c0_g1_i1.p1 TRINITY_DN17232_c0_g1~~TRINITY_DN17232_c0_g1_i1.p1  ORF type:complete len:412 (-),score=108.34 TRINITY_DN17232_c0_g1_i1:208-1314(-)
MVPAGQDVATRQAAIEQLLRTVAGYATTMDVSEILKLNDAFIAASAAASGSVGNSLLAVMAPAAQAPVAQAPQLYQQQQLLPEAAGAMGAGSFGAGVGGFADGSQLALGGCYGAGELGVQDAFALEPSAMDPQALAAHQAMLPKVEDILGGLQTVKVSAKTNVKAIAGAMSKALRNSEAFVATAVGPEGVNHAVKAMGIARCYLAAEGLDLTATIQEVQRDEAIQSGQCFAFTVARIMVAAVEAGPLSSPGVGRAEPLPRNVRPEHQRTEMRVAGGSGQAGPVAGAVAKCLREDQEVILTAMGPTSVAKCMEALAMARTYLRNEGYELAFFAGFEQIIMQGTGPGSGEQRSCLKVHVWRETTQATTDI